jgi:predicted amidophosphoribosyltransferase
MNHTESQAGIKSLRHNGTNSTLFTDCCGSAIVDEKCCPSCGKEVVGCHVCKNDRHRYRQMKAFGRQ